MEQFTIEKVRLSHLEMGVCSLQSLTQSIHEPQSHMLPGHCPVHQEGGKHAFTLRTRALVDRVQFDSRKGATWHCIVGRNFGSFVTHGMMPATVHTVSD
jgi:hypothetical protein